MTSWSWVTPTAAAKPECSMLSCVQQLADINDIDESDELDVT